MIVSKISKLNFIPPFKEAGIHYIELIDLFGKLIYRIELEGNNLKLERPKADVGYRFHGHFDYLKVHRNPDPLIDSFNVQLYCSNCQDKIYKLTGKLPLLFQVKTDFHVTKDTRKG